MILLAICSEASAYKSEQDNYLQNFGTEPKNDATFEAAEILLEKATYLLSNSATFDKVKYQKNKNKKSP